MATKERIDKLIERALKYDKMVMRIREKVFELDEVRSDELTEKLGVNY